jgi:hypothetical protein
MILKDAFRRQVGFLFRMQAQLSDLLVFPAGSGFCTETGKKMILKNEKNSAGKIVS